MKAGIRARRLFALSLLALPLTGWTQLVLSPSASADPVRRTTTIVSMGDSYAAGEGSPGPGRTWQDPLCHRSSNSALNLGINALRAASPFADPYVQLNVTCGGAKIDVTDGASGGILSPQRNFASDPNAERPAQIDQVEQWWNDNQLGIDVLTIGAGGNDAGFENLVRACGVPWNLDSCDGFMQDDLDAGLAAMRGHWAELIKAIQGDGQGGSRRLHAPVRDIYVTIYPDPTSKLVNGQRAYCDRQPLTDPVMGSVTGRESQWLSTVAVAGMNQVVRDVVNDANHQARDVYPAWHVIEPPDWSNHGWCAAQPWTNTYLRSQSIQGDEWGTAHPNLAGYSALGSEIQGALYYLNNGVRDASIRTTISAAHSNLPLQILAPGQGMPVMQGGPLDYEQFTFHASGTTVQVRSERSGKCLVNDPARPPFEPGAGIVLGDCASPSSRWDARPAPYGAWVFTRGFRMCWDIWLATTAWSAPLIQYPCHFANNQRWWI
ncbi:hypothetical protein Acor_07850 [Acrocarpospora corrugata]|uniref:Ricin B lectin domain-containing protein n=1 Tax=Acrocarpospora corrugata TaxID=35763 RepID=A0A5M3VUH0_9ACTN|nr:hypothetical protein [Acrocarpospora corrugata]GER98722.1 hypothetical protein Acor_07850 [Acrocarpospora corrugata]